jgi:hypothetical protein
MSTTFIKTNTMFHEFILFLTAYHLSPLGFYKLISSFKVSSVLSCAEVSISFLFWMSSPASQYHANCNDARGHPGFLFALKGALPFTYYWLLVLVSFRKKLFLYWGLNSGPHACYVGALPLLPLLRNSLCSTI